MKTLSTALAISEEEVRPLVGQRLDVFLAAVLERSRDTGAGAAETGPGRPCDRSPQKLRRATGCGQGIRSSVEPTPAVPLGADPSGEAIPLDIIYEDEALIALNKQPGLVVHPAAGHWSGTLVNALVHHCGAQLAGRGGQERLGIVHRLDKDTSGLMLVAKTDEAHEKLAAAFAAAGSEEDLIARCAGAFSGEPRANAAGRSGGIRCIAKKWPCRKIRSRAARRGPIIACCSRASSGAEVECLLHTGRTHQIRVHLSHLGHPIWGDTLYGKKTLVGDYYPGRQMLHSARIEIAHPLTGKALRLEAAFPPDYVEARARLIGL